MYVCVYVDLYVDLCVYVFLLLKCVNESRSGGDVLGVANLMRKVYLFDAVL